MKKALYLVLLTLSVFVLDAKAESFAEFKESAQCRTVGKGTAMSVVARGTQNKVLSASLNKRSSPPVYKVKTISKSGRVRTYRVDACTGRLLG